MFTTVSARMDTDLKAEAERILTALGLTHSTAINSFYSQVVLTRGIPFEMKLAPESRTLSFQQIRNAIRPIAKSFGIDRVYLFGSYARGDATASSDVDLRIDPGQAKGLAIGGFQYEAQELLGVAVDVVTTNSLSKGFLEGIANDEVLIYGR